MPWQLLHHLPIRPWVHRKTRNGGDKLENNIVRIEHSKHNKGSMLCNMGRAADAKGPKKSEFKFLQTVLLEKRQECAKYREEKLHSAYQPAALVV